MVTVCISTCVLPAPVAGCSGLSLTACALTEALAPILWSRSPRRVPLPWRTAAWRAREATRSRLAYGRRCRPCARSLSRSSRRGRPSWTGAHTELDWRRGLDKFVFPRLGDRRVDQVTLEDVIAVVQPEWNGRGSTGYLLRQRIDAILRWAVVKKYRLDNPAQQALDLLPKVRREPDHRPSLSYTKVAAAMTALRASSAPAVIKDLVLFIVLTAARLSEATKAPWSEIDFDDPVWSLPAGRMKAGRKHDVPLSGQALDLLQHVRGRGEFGPFVFCLRSSRGRLRPVTGETLNYWLRKLDLRDSEDRFVVTHGFRATFRSWTVQVAHVGAGNC